MKKHYLILTALAIVITIFSCKKEDAEEIAPLVTTASMTATVNDTAWSSITRITKHYPSTNLIVITGTDTDGKAIVITIKGDTKGTYSSSTSIDSLSAKVGCVWKPNSSEYVSNKGTVELTEVNTTENRISGTFNFDVVNTSELTDAFTIASGKFSNLKYSEESDTTSSK